MVVGVGGSILMVGGGWWHSLVHLEFTVTFSLFDLFDWKIYRSNVFHVFAKQYVQAQKI